MTCIPSVSNTFIQVLLVMVFVSQVLPLPLAAHLPVHDSLYDETSEMKHIISEYLTPTTQYLWEPPLVDYNFVPYSGMRINDHSMNEPFKADKRKNEFIRFGKRDDFMKFNKRKNEFIRFGKRSIKLKMF